MAAMRDRVVPAETAPGPGGGGTEVPVAKAGRVKAVVAGFPAVLRAREADDQRGHDRQRCDRRWTR